MGLGRWVFHDRERLVGVRARGPVLAMHTLRPADGIVPSRALDRPAPAQAPGERELQMAEMLVQGLHADWTPERLEDTYRERVLELVRAKAEGREVESVPAPAPEASDDLLAALQASLAAAR
jgi:DNA end-binding protein Ku